MSFVSISQDPDRNYEFIVTEFFLCINLINIRFQDYKILRYNFKDSDRSHDFKRICDLSHYQISYPLSLASTKWSSKFTFFAVAILLPFCYSEFYKKLNSIL
jgi:hypothetical protein